MGCKLYITATNKLMIRMINWTGEISNEKCLIIDQRQAKCT